jgi:hypothetical protein
MKSKLLILAIVSIALISFTGCQPVVDPSPPAETQAEQLARIIADHSLKTFLLTVATSLKATYDSAPNESGVLTDKMVSVTKPDAPLVIPDAVFGYYNTHDNTYEVWTSPAIGQYSDYPKYSPGTDMTNIHFYSCFTVNSDTLGYATSSTSGRIIPVSGGESGYVLPDLTFSPSSL